MDRGVLKTDQMRPHIVLKQMQNRLSTPMDAGSRHQRRILCLGKVQKTPPNQSLVTMGTLLNLDDLIQVVSILDRCWSIVLSEVMHDSIETLLQVRIWARSQKRNLALNLLEYLPSELTYLFHLLFKFLVRPRSLNCLEERVVLDRFWAGVPKPFDVTARNWIDDFFILLNTYIRVFIQDAAVCAASGYAV